MLALSFYKPFPKYATSFEADTCQRAASLSQQELKLTWRFPVFIFTIVPCFKFQMRTQIPTRTEESNTNQVWREGDQALSPLLNALPIEISPLFQPWYPLSTSLFMESPKHRQGSDVEKEAIPNAIGYSFRTTDFTVVQPAKEACTQTTHLNSLLPLLTQHYNLSKWEHSILNV